MHAERQRQRRRRGRERGIRELGMKDKPTYYVVHNYVIYSSTTVYSTLHIWVCYYDLSREIKT